MSALDVAPDALIKVVAEELKKNPVIKTPEWVLLVKTGADRERLPEREDFWFTRCASLLRTLYIHGSRGVQRLRHKYGGRKEHVVRRAHHKKGGGKIIRIALQQLEQAGLVKKEKTGRTLTDAGKSLLDKTAASAGKT